MEYLDSSKRSKLREDIKYYPGWEIHWACSRLLNSFYIFDRNYSELKKFLENPPIIKFQFLPDEKARNDKIRSDSETARLIHNFVAGANTIVDHYRRAKEKYLADVEKVEFDNLIDSGFNNQPRLRLLKDLRNFILHYDLPVISNRIKLEDGTSKLELIPEKMLKWKNWNSDVKIYLKDLSVRKENIQILKVVVDYAGKTKKLTEFLIQNIAKCNSQELEDLYSSLKLILESVKKDGYVTDPLIVQFFSESFRLTSQST